MESKANKYTFVWKDRGKEQEYTLGKTCLTALAQIKNRFRLNGGVTIRETGGRWQLPLKDVERGARVCVERQARNLPGPELTGRERQKLKYSDRCHLTENLGQTVPGMKNLTGYELSESSYSGLNPIDLQHASREDA